MTAYRQRALACAARLADGAKRPRDLRPLAPDAGAILLRNVYGWFVRAGRGVYVLTDTGHEALARWPQAAMPAGDLVACHPGASTETAATNRGSNKLTQHKAAWSGDLNEVKASAHS